MTRIPHGVCGILLLELCTCASASRPKPAKPTVQANLPARYGKLQVVGTHLCDSNGKPVQLRGMCSVPNGEPARPLALAGRSFPSPRNGWLSWIGT